MAEPPPRNRNDSFPEAGDFSNLSSRVPRRMRGYDRSATDRLFAELAAKQTELTRESARLRDQVAQLEADLERHRSQEQLVSQTLLTATSHATTIKESARREAEQVLSKAHGELERRAERAELAERDRAEAERELLRLRRLAQEMRGGLESFLTQALEQLRPEAGSGEPASPQTAADPDLVGTLEATVKQENPERLARSADVEPNGSQ